MIEVKRALDIIHFCWFMKNDCMALDTSGRNNDNGMERE